MQTDTLEKLNEQICPAQGNVTAAKGFQAAGIHAGFKRKRKDLALIYSENLAATASVYTQNKVKGAPLEITRLNSLNGRAQALICNSGNANTCNANGLEIAGKTCELLSQSLGIEEQDVLVASTGVIGQPLSIEPFAAGIPQLVSKLSEEAGSLAAEAILTTDTGIKEKAVTFDLNGCTVTLGGISKGSGMIHPNMATMLGFITTDANIEPAVLQQALTEVTSDTFNMISVDGDTSTNDMVTILANGKAGNSLIQSSEQEEYRLFKQALNLVCRDLAVAIAADGEGAGTLITCNVLQAKDEQQAKLLAKQIISSSLVKAAVYGRDANVGRLLCAMGYSGAELNYEQVDIYLRSADYRSVCVCEAGAVVPFDEDKAYEVLGTDKLFIDIYLYAGTEQATAWGCDLTKEYVTINSAYRS